MGPFRAAFGQMSSLCFWGGLALTRIRLLRVELGSQAFCLFLTIDPSNSWFSFGLSPDVSYNMDHDGWFSLFVLNRNPPPRNN